MTRNDTSTIQTARLTLRPLCMKDAPALAHLAGQREIADTTISIPHPLDEKRATAWLTGKLSRQSAEVVFAITLRSNHLMIGAAGLMDIDPVHAQAELGSWIGTPWWGRGYATEAAKAVLGHAFGEMQLNRVHAHYMTRNPASGCVLKKIGMQREGLLRQRVKKWEVFEDVVILAILRQDWQD